MNTPKLQNLLVWVEKVTDTTPGDFQPVGKRAIALVNALTNANANAYAYAYALAKDKAKALAYAKAKIDANAYSFINAYANAYAHAIDRFIEYAQQSQKFVIYRNVNFTTVIAKLEQLKEQRPDDKTPKQKRKDFGKRIIPIWLEAFHLTPEMVDLSESELEALDNYFYANLLMVRCKEAAVRVSKETWKGIEARMLLPVG